MSKNTLQGWCTPTLHGYADHTFVYCPEAKSYFNCWGGGDINAEDTVQVCSKEYEGAYCRANNYRLSIGRFKDTAGVGIYGVNGVCHQSANLFLYSSGTLLPLFKSRPKGIIASHAMYGFYGTDIPNPGDLLAQGTHFLRWRLLIYKQANLRCISGTDESEKLEINSDESLFQKVNELHNSVFETNQNILSAEDLIVNEFKIIAKEMAPDIDVNQFDSIHRDFLKEKDDILKSAKIYGDKPEEIKLPQGKTAEEVVEKLNDLICEFQKSLAESVGSSHYEQLTGNKQNEIFRLIDPRIAVENWSNY